MARLPERAARRPVLALLLALLLAAGPFLSLARPARAAQTFVVNRATDQADRSLTDPFCDVSSAPGRQSTLRAAIQEANTTPVADTIHFAIPGGGVKLIKPNNPATPGGPNGALPPITRPVTIDGYTQPGSGVNTAAVGTNAKIRIELDGAFTTDAAGLTVGANADNTSIRGLAIGRFDGTGMTIDGDDVRVTGCFVGTNAAGLAPRPNGTGILVFGNDAAIGNSPAAARNLISGNTDTGVFLTGGPVARALGNLIGTDKTGTNDLGNGGDGVFSQQSDTRLGGDGAGEPNVIQFNGGAGVNLDEFGVSGHRILRNAIGANGGLGIDLNGDGVQNPSDAGHADAGGNNLQNSPVITVAATNLVQITFNSNPNQNFTIRLYSNPGAGDEGVRYHGTFPVSTDGAGITSGAENNLVPNPSIAPGRSVTATATRGNGDTSEFSDAVLIG